MVKHQRTFVVFETTSNVNSFVRAVLCHSTTLFSDFPAFYTYMYACIIVRTMYMHAVHGIPNANYCIITAFLKFHW